MKATLTCLIAAGLLSLVVLVADAQTVGAQKQKGVFITRLYERGCQHKHFTIDRPMVMKPIVTASLASVETIG